MKAYLVWMATGPQIILTSCDLVTHSDCLKKLADEGITKFVAQEVPVEVVKEKYGESYEGVMNDPKETDELRVLDTSGARVLNNISFRNVSEPIYYEEGQSIAKPGRLSV